MKPYTQYIHIIQYGRTAMCTYTYKKHCYIQHDSMTRTAIDEAIARGKLSLNSRPKRARSGSESSSSSDLPELLQSFPLQLVHFLESNYAQTKGLHSLVRGNSCGAFIMQC